ncbi:MAG: hypothetical protein KJ893_06315 [Candidatus Omnitrophica bacterium]|nr:hypothetical protein [Candidatus Omnitrophota bacterium]MBU4478053.1 hypothetical protein [Candidatus Omnitrophota bacterium]
MLKRVSKLIIGIALIPVCVGASIAFYELICAVRPQSSAHVVFLAGIVCYAVLYLASFKMNFLYVLGHEAVHAIFALLCGGTVKSFNVSTKGGSVGTTKTNVLISLGPYFFPFYTIILCAGFMAAAFFRPEIIRYANVFMFLLGFSISFHFLMTVNSLRTEQPDLAENGHLFSITLLYLINLIILAVLLSVVFKGTDIAGFFYKAAEYSRGIFSAIWQALARGGSWLMAHSW